MAANANERSKALFKRSLVWDMTLPWSADFSDDITLPRFAAAGINFISLTVATDSLGPELALKQIACVRDYVARQPDKFVLVHTVDDILAAKTSGKLALGMHFQGTNPLAGDLSLIEMFYKLGIRHMLMAYQLRNFVADGCGERTDAGLSKFGIGMIKEMNRVGMIVDGSHTGYRSSMDALEASSAPCIFSHANAYGVFAHYRNIKDDQIKACAKTGGVIGINGLGAFLGEDEFNATPETMFRHIDYIVNLAGPAHVGIGLDYVKDVPKLIEWVKFNADAWPPNNGREYAGSAFAQPEDLARLCEVMCQKGYSDADIGGVLGGNFLRVCRQVWK
jgi:membrane dipeptidase